MHGPARVPGGLAQRVRGMARGEGEKGRGLQEMRGRGWGSVYVDENRILDVSVRCVVGFK